MPTQITIDHVDSARGSRHSSISTTDDSHGTGVQISPPSVSGSAAYSGSDRSESHGSREFVHLPYPDELHPEDSASRLPGRAHRHPHSREVSAHRHSVYRHDSRHRPSERESLAYRPRVAPPPAPESVDSLEEFGHYARPGPPAHRQTFAFGAPHYASSASESFAQYPPVPSTQMIQAVPSQPYGSYSHYPQAPHPNSHAGYYQGSLAGASSVSSAPYGSHFSPPPSVPYSHPNPGYFPPYTMTQYAMPPGAYVPYAPPPRSPSPAKKSASPAPSAPSTSHEDTLKMMKELFEKQQQQIEERDKAKEAERKAIEDAKKAAEERAALDKKLQEEAAAAAKAEGDKKLAEAAEKAAKELQEAKDAAEKALKDAKEAAEKETAEKVAAAKVVPAVEKKAPIKFKDAIGRKYQFPWDMCCKWNNMEELIRQAFAHVEGMAQHVYDGHYDLSGPSGEIILKDCWEATVEPDWTITMHMWPLPEPPPEPDPMTAVFEGILEDKKEKKNAKPGKKGAKIPVAAERKKRGGPKEHGAIPVPPPPPMGPPGPMVFDTDSLFGEMPIIDVPGPDMKSKKAGKRPQSGLFSSWVTGGRAGPSKTKKK